LQSTLQVRYEGADGFALFLRMAVADKLRKEGYGLLTQNSNTRWQKCRVDELAC